MWWVWLLWHKLDAAFSLGLAFGFGWFGVGAWWLIETLHVYGALPYISSSAIIVMLGLILALFPALAAWLAAWAAGKEKYWFCLTLPLAMALAEWLRGHVFTGLPWIALGNLLINTEASTSLAWLGVYGSSAVFIVFVFVLWAIIHSFEILPSYINQYIDAEQYSASVLPLSISMSMIIIITVIWAWLISPLPLFVWSDANKPLHHAALIQGNIPQDQKWDAAFLEHIMQRYSRLSAQAARNKVIDIIIWPEAALPFFPAEAPQWSNWLHERMLEWNKPVLFGGLKAGYDGDTLYGRNGLYLFQPDKHNMATYNMEALAFAGKKHLVPFGEYVPDWLPMVRKIVPFTMDFRPDTGNSILVVDGVRFGALICYEAIFPEEARARVLAGANVLVHVSNDAWYGKTPAAYQHLQAARVRAIETGRYVLRIANTGITAIIAPDGSVQEQINWFADGILIAKFQTINKQTFYTRWGDLPLLLMLLVLLAIAWNNSNYNRNRKDKSTKE